MVDHKRDVRVKLMIRLHSLVAKADSIGYADCASNPEIRLTALGQSQPRADW